MKTFSLNRGLDIPLTGKPRQEIIAGGSISHVALTGDDYAGLKPSMLVREGDEVKLGQPVFTDKKNPGFNFTAPGSGRIKAICRGAKRKFESLIIELHQDVQERFPSTLEDAVEQMAPEKIREVIQTSGLWPSFRKRPFGVIPKIDARPSSLFITAMDTDPLAADPLVIIRAELEQFNYGIKVLTSLLEVPIHLCLAKNANDLAFADGQEEKITVWQFSGPHPAGLPSTHIHFIDPVHSGKEAWHIGYQDVMKLGFFFQHGYLSSTTVVALSGEGFAQNILVQTREGAAIEEICTPFSLDLEGYRVLSGSVLDGRPLAPATGFLGRYHRQISTVKKKSGRSLFGWCKPGSDRFSVTGLFLSRWRGKMSFPAITAVWGGHRAIYPLGVYQDIMPLDLAVLPLLKALAMKDAEKAIELGCLELVEEDLALCSYVCPGKNEFGPMLRDLLTVIEKES